MTSFGLEIVDLTEIVGEWDEPCDYSEEPACDGGSPSWVLFFSCCGDGSGVRLACDICKDERLLDRVSVQCPACGHIWEHAPEAYSRIEPLERA